MTTTLMLVTDDNIHRQPVSKNNAPLALKTLKEQYEIPAHIEQSSEVQVKYFIPRRFVSIYHAKKYRR